MKGTYYFSHDTNARNDEKILMLRAEHGWQGYGIFWALVEMMFETNETYLSHSKIKGIAISYNIDITLLQSIINTCISENLFASDEKTFWSETLRERKQKFLDYQEKKSNAGKKGMAKRWASHNTVITQNNNVITENNKGKEIKENKIKENKNINARTRASDLLSDQEQRFSEFWQSYPKKIGKKAALSSWKRIKPDITLFNKIIASVEVAKKSRQWQRDEGQYISNPATWLNQGRWDDELEEVNTNVVRNDRQHTRQYGEEPFSLSGFKSADDED